MSENWQMLLYLGALLTEGQAASHSTRPFGLKGDVLGETIQEFRIHNDRTISTPPKAKQHLTKHMPICSNDTVHGSADIGNSLPTEEETRAGVITCRANLSRHENMDLFWMNVSTDFLELAPLFHQSRA